MEGRDDIPDMPLPLIPIDEDQTAISVDDPNVGTPISSSDSAVDSEIISSIAEVQNFVEGGSRDHSVLGFDPPDFVTISAGDTKGILLDYDTVINLTSDAAFELGRHLRRR